MTTPTKPPDNWTSTSTTAASPVGLDLRLVWKVIQDRRALILLSGLLTFLVVMTATLLSPMEFQVHGRLYLGELDEHDQYGSLSELAGAGGSDVYSEIEIMRSRSRVERAVLIAGLNATLLPQGVTRPKLWQWLTAKRDPALLDTDRARVRIEVAALPARDSQSRAFRVEFKSAESYLVRDEDGRVIGGTRLGEPLSSRQLTLTLAKGDVGAPRAGDVYNLALEPTERAVDKVLSKLDITLPKASSPAAAVKVLALDLVSTRPHQASAFLNALMQTHLDERQIWKTEDAEAAEEVIVQQLASMQSSLDNSEQALARFKADNRVVAEQSQPQVIVTQLANYEQERTSARLQVSALENMLKNLGRPDANVEAFLLGESQDSVMQQLSSSLAQSRQALAELLSQAHEGTSEVKQQRAKVDEQLTMIRKYVSGRLTRARAQVQQLDAVIAQYNTELSAVPAAELELAQLGRRSDVYSRVYSYLLESQQRTAIAKATRRSKNRILDRPAVPAFEVAPNLMVRSLSGLFGVFAAALVLVVRVLSSGTLRTEADVRNVLRNAPVLANVPRIPRKLLSKKSSPIYDLSALPHTGLGVAEAFRTLRANLYYNLPGQRGKVVLVSSPSPGDGKTTTTLCLAGALAADDKRVLVVDADLRKPSHYQLLGHEVEQGLAMLDPTTGTLPKAPQRIYLSNGVIYAIDPGFGLPNESLSSQAFARFLERARHDFDFILLDAPAYPAAADPLVLAGLSDFALSVVRLGTTSRADAEAHVFGLASRVRNMAVVLNDSDTSSVPGHARHNRVTRMQPQSLPAPPSAAKIPAQSSTN